jgi:multiple sugar transport system substrate-binding protein
LRFSIKTKVVLALTLVLFVSCGSDERTPLRLMLPEHAALDSKLRHVLDVFEQRNPGVRVEVIRARSNGSYAQQVIAEHALAGAPDIFLIGLSDFHALEGKGLMRDLSGKLDDLFDFQPRLIECFMRDGKLMAVPAECSTRVLYYNRQKFDRAGIPYPTESWDWSDLRLAAEKLTIRETPGGPPIQHGLQLDPSLAGWAAFVWQNGGEIGDPASGRWVIGSPSHLERNAAALEFYAGLIHEARIAPAVSALQGDQPARPAFVSQTAAMIFDERPLAAELLASGSLHWDVSPLPRHTARATTLSAEGYAISSKTADPDLAWKLVRHLTGPTSQTRFAMTGRMLPSRVSVARSRVFLDFPGAGPIRNKAFVDGLYYARPLPFDRALEVERILAEETDLLFSAGRGNARDALIRAQARIDELFGQKSEAPRYLTVPPVRKSVKEQPKAKKASTR